MRQNRLRYLITGAALAALFIVCASLLHIPTAFGFVHFADAFLYLSAYLLPTPAACLTCIVGGALADIFAGYAVYAPATAVIKTLMILFISKKKKPLSLRNALALVYGLAVNVGGYYIFNSVLYEGSLVDGLSAALASVPTDALQSVLSAAIFVAVATAADKLGYGGKSL